MASLVAQWGRLTQRERPAQVAGADTAYSGDMHAYRGLIDHETWNTYRGQRREWKAGRLTDPLLVSALDAEAPGWRMDGRPHQLLTTVRLVLDARARLGRTPVNGDKQGDVDVGMRIQYLRKRDSTAGLSPEATCLLDAEWPSWRTEGTKADKSLCSARLVLDQRARLGRAPRVGDAVDGVDAGLRLASLRQAERIGHLGPSATSLLDTEWPRWRDEGTKSDQSLLSARLVLKVKALRGRSPRKGDMSDGIDVSVRLSGLRQSASRGTLGAEATELLDAEWPTWRSGDGAVGRELHSARIVLDAYARLGRAPRGTGSQEEVAPARRLHTLRKLAIDGALSVEAGDLLHAEWPGWRNEGTKAGLSLSSARLVLDERARLHRAPRQGDMSGSVDIGRRLAMLRARAKGGTLSPEAVSLLDSEWPAWRTERAPRGRRS